MRERSVRAIYDPAAMAGRLEKYEARAAKVADVDPDAARTIRAQGVKVALKAADAVIAEAAATGAAAPTVERGVKGAFRVTLAATPPGSNAAPAWVVRFDGNAPVSRLGRGDPPALDAMHLSAARRLVALHEVALAPAPLTSNYEGVGGRGASLRWSELRCDAWDDMRDALRLLLPDEARIVLSVVVHDASIEELARSRLVTFRKPIRAEAAVVQTLRLGLERLALHWALDAGGARD